MILFKKVAIVGVGLIGGSLGLRIKDKNLADRVIGIGHRKKSIAQALRLKSIDEGSLSLLKIKDADLVILALPVGLIIEFLPKISGLVKKGCIVIDVGSTKNEIVRAAEKLNIDFVGCHPLAGLEKRGVQSARSGLFDNSLCLLVPLKRTRKEVLMKVKHFWEELGAKTKMLGAEAHDRILGFVSHLPHAVAFCLVNCIKPEYLLYGAGGLRDMTRIASSDPYLWRDIFLTNRKELIKSIRKFKGSLSLLESFLKKNHPKPLAAFLKKSRDKRNEL